MKGHTDVFSMNLMNQYETLKLNIIAIVLCYLQDIRVVSILKNSNTAIHLNCAIICLTTCFSIFNIIIHVFIFPIFVFYCRCSVYSHYPNKSLHFTFKTCLKPAKFSDKFNILLKVKKNNNISSYQLLS